MMAVSTVVLRFMLKFLFIFCIRKPAYASSNSVCYSFYGEEVVDLNQSHIYSLIWLQQQQWNLKVRSKVSLQILLLLSGDIESCPGPLQERKIPELEMLMKLKGLKCFHLNRFMEQFSSHN